MVEVIYNEKNAEATKTENLIRLPKNIRQIGVAGNHLRIYMEDYVQSYIHRLSACQEGTCFVLFGKKIIATDRQYIFISGAVRVIEEHIFHQNVEVYTDAWDKLRIVSRQFFADLEQVGWANTREDMSAYDAEIIHRRFFSDKNDIFYQTNENEETFYMPMNGVLRKEEGYFIYFSPNEAMQNYMIESREEKAEATESELPDETMIHFRTVMKERKENAQHQRTITYLSFASTFLVILVMAIGITMINNYEKMREMETTLAGISTLLTEESDILTAQEEYSEGEMKTTVDLSEEAEHVEIVNEAFDETEEAEKTEAEPAEAELAGTELTEAEPTEAEPTEAEPTEAETAEAETAGTELTEAGPAGTELTETEPTEAEKTETESETAVQAGNTRTTYVVKKGDTLAKISWKFYQSTDMVDEICELNQIDNRDIILYGNEILLP